MTKNHSLALFGALILVLLGLSWWHTGSFAPPSGPDAIWFHAGLFTLVLGRFITEYRFTKPNDVFLNCVAVFASTSTLTNPPNSEWWLLLRWGSLIVGTAAIGLAWDPGREAKLADSRARSIAYQVVTQLGRAEVIFSLVFVLALISYFDLRDYKTKVFVVAWGGMLIAAHLNLSQMTRLAFLPANKDRRVIGVAHSFLAPSIVFCRRLGTDRIAMHQLVGFTQSGAGSCHCLGIVIGERASATETRIAVALLHRSISESHLNDRSLVVTVGESEREAFDPPVRDAELNALKKVVGTVAKGTNIGQVKFELFGSPVISAGALMKVGIPTAPVFYQIFDGVIDEEQTVNDSARAFVEGEAEQVGYWDPERGGFETHDWVAKERAPVFLMDEDEAAPEYRLKDREMTVGKIPKSNYPVNVDIHDMVLFHSAILGVTGSGKSFLTFSVIEDCARQGIKTVCIDPTGDYQRYLPDAVLIIATGALEAFLASPDHMIGIVETAARTSPPVEQTHEVARICLAWCKGNRADGDVLNPRPKVQIVLEEAHLLVPEWNFNPVQGQQATVNKTAQIVLQARKYGLGFLIVSQRTANVTKSVLNQCNTIISFQAFDETGFDFLKNYMGSFHVRSLPNLKPRHGILVGKASRSRRPVMVHFLEQARALRAQPAPQMPLPAAPAPHVPGQNG